MSRILAPVVIAILVAFVRIYREQYGSGETSPES